MNQQATLSPDSEDRLYDRVRDLVVTARQSVARGVDLVQVRTNFEIGRHIVEHEQQGADRAGYGESVVRRHAEKLVSEFGKGLSKSNLEYMRRFYLTFQDRLAMTQTASEPSHAVFSLPANTAASIAQTVSGQLKSSHSRGRFGFNAEQQRLAVQALGGGA